MSLCLLKEPANDAAAKVAVGCCVLTPGNGFSFCMFQKEREKRASKVLVQNIGLPQILIQIYPISASYLFPRYIQIPNSESPSKQNIIAEISDNRL